MKQLLTVKEYRTEDPFQQTLMDFKLFCGNNISTSQSPVDFTNSFKNNSNGTILFPICSMFISTYIYSVERSMQVMRNLIQQHGIELKKGKEDLKSNTKALTYVRVELEVTRKELKQVKKESKSTRNALRQAQVAINSTRVHINVIEKDNAHREDIDHIRADANTSRDEFNAIIKGKIKPSIEHPSHTLLQLNNSNHINASVLTHNRFTTFEQRYTTY